MSPRHDDGSAGDADYGVIGGDYVSYRQPEPAIAAAIGHALGGARTLLNVGAGTGSYEPLDRAMTAVEPSASMRAQRPGHLATALNAVAEALPFPNGQFEASMATFTAHQWTALEAGLAEMRRVTRGPVVILTCDPALVQRFWLNDYAPDVLATEARRYPALDRITAVLGGVARIVRFQFRCTARTVLTKLITAGPNVCWTKVHERRVRHGALSAWRRVSLCGAPTQRSRGGSLGRPLRSSAHPA
jgi:SAM-dependent methyltransferase